MTVYRPDAEKKASLMALIESYAAWHGMFREKLVEPNNHDSWKIMKSVRDEKWAEIKALVDLM